MGSSLTTSAVRAEAETGSHIFMISGYSLTKGIGIDEFICSDVFTIGGYDWVIRFYPDGESIENKDFISFFLELESTATDVKARYTFTILKQDGLPSDISYRGSQICTFNNSSETDYSAWGCPHFKKRSEFEASKYLKDDAFTIQCTVTVLKGTNILQATTPYGVTVPPSNLSQHLLRLLESGHESDVTLVVKGERFKAHRLVLAARSAVFNAALFGCMNERWTDTITFDDIEPLAFKSMLYFIYSDSLPDFEVNSDANDGEKQDLKLMAQHLLVAADRFDLERLKLMCEDFLYKNPDVSTVASTLILAERHNCNQLKAQCLRFMSSPGILKAVAPTDAFHVLMRSFPSILKDLILFCCCFFYYFITVII
ncbi:hypothetical protein LUZ63_016492 [Rhynchospora breviuscula]|uniref:Uncharacterized protein n=1 Tax=Rhynchospora breviuscula TaxID=2022672 RepID=A0A9P9ZA06_9POAL|nr:hypothetical protein LUZ63_016492 [Rhynchospora breviuscula]